MRRVVLARVVMAVAVIGLLATPALAKNRSRRTAGRSQYNSSAQAYGYAFGQVGPGFSFGQVFIGPTIYPNGYGCYGHGYGHPWHGANGGVAPGYVYGYQAVPGGYHLPSATAGAFDGSPHGGNEWYWRTQQAANGRMSWNTLNRMMYEQR